MPTKASPAGTFDLTDKARRLAQEISICSAEIVTMLGDETIDFETTILRHSMILSGKHGKGTHLTHMQFDHKYMIEPAALVELELATHGALTMTGRIQGHIQMMKGRAHILENTPRGPKDPEAGWDPEPEACWLPRPSKRQGSSSAARGGSLASFVLSQGADKAYGETPTSSRGDANYGEK